LFSDRSSDAEGAPMRSHKRPPKKTLNLYKKRGTRQDTK